MSQVPAHDLSYVGGTGEHRFAITRQRKPPMFRKTLFTVVAAAALATTTFAPAAFAGGHGKNHGRDYQHPWAFGARDAAVTRHIDWCLGHYNSYRASDNTFQSGQGARLQCSSPFISR